MTKKKEDKPYMPFFIGDWFKAPEIRALPHQYRMVWFEILCLMWQAEEKGYLTIKGKPFVITNDITNDITSVITDGCDVLASMLGITEDFLQDSFYYFKKLDVYSVRKDGAVYSRFMVKLLGIKEVRSKSGKEGMKSRYSKNGAKGSLKISDFVITSDITISEYEYICINNSLNDIEDEHLKKDRIMVVVEMFKIFKKAHPDYPKDQEKDYHALLQFAYRIAESKNWSKTEVITTKELGVLDSWAKIASYIVQEKWLKTKSLSVCLSSWQSIVMGMKEKAEKDPVDVLESKRIRPEDYFTED